MNTYQPKLENHFFLPEDQSLFDYDQIFSVSSMWLELGMGEVEATFDLFVRGMPENRNFLMFGGLEEIIESIKAWHFSPADIAFLLDNGIIKEKMAENLKNFKFGGDIYAMPEGTVFFSHEPVVRLTGKLWQINLFTFFLINVLSSNCIFLSKIARSMLAAAGKINVVTCSVTRAHAHEASLKFGRAAYILGAPASVVPAFARKYGVPVSKVNTKAYHAFIKSFKSELEAFRAATKVFSSIGLMVDTYDVKQGIANAITVAKEIAPEGKKIAALVLDSGRNVKHYAEQAVYARHELDQAGLLEVKITATGNFNELKIAELVALGAPVDNIIACTDLVTSCDDAKLESVLKLAEFTRDGELVYSAKLTEGKESYPAKKQVFRTYKNNLIDRDILALEAEQIDGQPLLECYLKEGKQVKDLPNIDDVRDYTLKQLSTLTPELASINKKVDYQV